MNLKPIRMLLCGVLAAFPFAASAAPKPADVPPAYRAFAEQLAREDGVVESDVLAILAKAQVQPAILEAIARPAEAKPWKDYRPIFMTDKRIADGIAFYRDNRELLERVGRQIGVEPQIVVAILGVETNYGRITGKYRVLDALVTLAFNYPPREPFFRGELRQLILLGDRHLAYPIDELKGSYAGAMGWGQFMPSSIVNYARDDDGDGRIDLWNSLPDITASVANYFVGHGWVAGDPVAVPATAQPNARTLEPGSLEPVYPLSQLHEWGYVPDGEIAGDPLATLLRLDGETGPEYWLTFRNFYVISRYNRSPLYSMAVWQLSQAIARGMDATP